MMTKRERTILSKKIVAGVKYAIAYAMNEHKAAGRSIIVWDEKKKKAVEIPASRIKRRRLKF